METKILINALLLIIIFYLLLDCIPHRYVFGEKKQYYQNENYKDVKGFSLKLGKDRVVLADEAQLDRVEKQIAEDIQRIVDAQGRGYDTNIFNKDFLNGRKKG